MLLCVVVPVARVERSLTHTKSLGRPHGVGNLAFVGDSRMDLVVDVEACEEQIGVALVSKHQVCELGGGEFLFGRLE